MKVFLVEDSPLIDERLTELLSAIEGVVLVGHAEDAGKAIDSIYRLQPDVVVLDVHLREGDGLQVLRITKRDQISPIFIVLTAFPYPHIREQCLAAGADYFFDKTSEFDHVTELIRQIHQAPVG